MFTTILVQPLFNLLMFIYAFVPGHDFGIAIIIMTILVRLALWPILASQLRSQKKLQALSPDVARVKKEAKGDKQLESKLLMELYKEKEINPFASLIPLLVQLPLFLGLYIALRDVIKPGEIAHLIYPSLHHLAGLREVLAHPSGFKPSFLSLINLSKPSPLLALVAGGTQYFQTKQLIPKATPGDTQAQAMAMTTKIFPFITFLIGLRLPSALALYWAMASAVAIFQQTIELKEDVQALETVKPDKPKPAKVKK